MRHEQQTRTLMRDEARRGERQKRSSLVPRGSGPHEGGTQPTASRQSCMRPSGIQLTSYNTSVWNLNAISVDGSISIFFSFLNQNFNSFSFFIF
jgi:hypothetical protein